MCINNALVASAEFRPFRCERRGACRALFLPILVQAYDKWALRTAIRSLYHIYKLTEMPISGPFNTQALAA